MFLFDREALVRRSPAAFAERRSVRFQDVDAAGIIFYPRLLEYFHDLYVAYLAHIGFPLHEVLRDRPWISPVRHAQASYMKPLRFGDLIEVALVAAHAEATEVTLAYRVARAESDEITGVGQVVHTFLDPKTFQRTAIPGPLLLAYAALAGDG